MAFSNPLFDTLRVEDVLFVAVESRHEVVSQKVAPADRALTPQAVFAGCRPSILLFRLLLLVLKLSFVERRNDLGDGEWDGEESPEHSFNEKVAAFFLLNVLHLLLELGESHWVTTFTSFTVIAFLFKIPTAHQVDPPLNDRLDKTDGLCNDDDTDDIVEADQVAEHGDDLERRVK